MAFAEPVAAPSKSKVLTFVKFTLFLGLGILIIWLSLKDLTSAERSQIIHSFRVANYWWVLLAVILGVFSHLIRALRWQLFFTPMGFMPGLKMTFYAVMVGYFANLAFPRLGEVTRCGVLSRYEKVPFQKAFGTVITERALDMIVFFMLFLLMILTQMGTIHDYMDNTVYPKLYARFGALHYSRLFILFLSGLIIFILLILILIRKRIQRSSLYCKFIELFKGFWEGLKSLTQIRRPLLFVVYTMMIWILYFFMLYIIFFCFRETGSLTLGAGLSALVLGSIGIMITPGGIGLYPAIIQETLLLYGVARPTGLALGWIAWTAQTVMILIVGGLSLLMITFNKQKNGKT